MSNLGLRRAMARIGVEVIETQVGDRYVLEALNERSLSLGGEQSGHVILRDFATTGDGILTGLHLAAEVAASRRPLSELKQVMQVFPQVLVNVRDVRREGCATDPGVQDAVRRIEAELGDSGRVLLRPSGTEPVVRVMVEAATAEDARRHADALADVVADRLHVAPSPVE